jgi:hypothetical protein
MFNWATEKLEKLSQTVAPPPEDPVSRYVYCVQKHDEAGAQACLVEIDPLYTIVQSSKGTTPLHLACGHSMVNLIRQILTIPGASTEVTDAAGNTPLHHASMSTDTVNGANVVKMLVTEYNASVVAKNWQGQTPYDVATLNGIRQYLLPIQLQQETQQAIDNGGVGLPPGIDMGGLRISQPAMPPPPIGGGAPPMSPAANNNGPPNMLATPSPNMPPSIPAASGPPMVTQSAGAIPAAPSSGRLERSASTSSAPSSGNSAHREYSRSGSSSAAILSKAKFRPDGFHSSSSDVSLQKKYGHSSHGTPAAAIPPPPSSGNSAGPPSGGSYNPYAAGSSAFGSANRYGAASSRYPVYGAGQPAVAATPSSGGYGGVPQQTPAPSYAIFQPSVQTQQEPAYQQPEQPVSSFMSPPPYQNHTQQQPAAAYHQQQQPQQSAYQPQSMTQQQQPHMNAPYQPYSQQAAVPMQQPQQMNAYQQSQQQAQQQHFVAASIPGPYPMAHTVSAGNTSAASAEELFASPSPDAKETTSRTITADSTQSCAHELFASGELSSGSVQQPVNFQDAGMQQGLTQVPTTGITEGVKDNTAEVSSSDASVPASDDPTPVAALAAGGGTAADFFGSNGTAANASATPADKPSPQDAINNDVNAAEAFDGMDDVPLEEVPLTPSEGNANGPTRGAAARTSIGLPPPPFSSRQ